jgi:hypothetical protein
VIETLSSACGVRVLVKQFLVWQVNFKNDLANEYNNYLIFVITKELVPRLEMFLVEYELIN